MKKVGCWIRFGAESFQYLSKLFRCLSKMCKTLKRPVEIIDEVNSVSNNHNVSRETLGGSIVDGSY